MPKKAKTKQGAVAMAQSLASVKLHLIFSTVDRRRVFRLERMRAATGAYLAGVFKNLKSPAIRIGVATDHVHALFLLPRTSAVAGVVGSVKAAGSDWIKDQEWARGNADFAEFAWQSGYGVFSVSESQVPATVAYIDRQMEQHRRVTFQDEFRQFLTRHNVEYDERYVWD